MTCQECQDLLLLYATAALDPAEAAAVRAHLATGCPACAGELAAAEAALHKIPLALPPQQPPESAWEKLETRIALKEQAEGPVGDRAALAAPFTPRRPSPLAWTGWAAAAAIIVLAGFVWRHASEQEARARIANSEAAEAVKTADSLQKSNDALEKLTKTLSDQYGDEITHGKELAAEREALRDILFHADQFAVTSPEQPTAGGKLYWDKAKQVWYIYLDNVKPAEPGKTYELWIVTASDKLAAGTAQVDDKGRMVFITSRKLPDGISLAAITDESAPGEPDNGAKGKIQFLVKLAP